MKQFLWVDFNCLYEHENCLYAIMSSCEGDQDHRHKLKARKFITKSLKFSSHFSNFTPEFHVNCGELADPTVTSNVSWIIMKDNNKMRKNNSSSRFGHIDGFIFTIRSRCFTDMCQFDVHSFLQHLGFLTPLLTTRKGESDPSRKTHPGQNFFFMLLCNCEHSIFVKSREKRSHLLLLFSSFLSGLRTLFAARSPRSRPE